MVYGAIRISADIIGAAVFSLGITLTALVSTFIALFSGCFRRRTRPAVDTCTDGPERPVQLLHRNRRTCLPGLRIAIGLHPVARREVMLDAYYRVCTELALPDKRCVSGSALGTERVLTGIRPGRARLRFRQCRVLMVRRPAVQVL